MKQEGQDVAICGGGRRQAELRGGDGNGSVTRSVEQCLGRGVSRWSRAGRAGPGCPWQPGLLTVLRDCGRGSFGAVAALELRAGFTAHFHRLQLNCSECSWRCCKRWLQGCWLGSI